MFQFVPGGDPEEIERAQREAHLRHDVVRHEVRKLFAELPEDQLKALNVLLHVLADGGDTSANTASYYHGLATVFLETRFGTCTACSQNPCTREQALDHALKGLLPDTPPMPTDAAIPTPRVAAEGSTEPPVDAPDLKIGETGLFSISQVEAMVKFDLEDVRELETNKLLGFECMNCKMQYQTIEDRAKEPPGVRGCSGCQQKVKFG